MLGYNGPDESPAPWGHITCVSVSAYSSRQWLSCHQTMMISNTFSMLSGRVRRQSRGHLGKYGSSLLSFTRGTRFNHSSSTARNLKFYPFSLKLAIEEGLLKFLSTIEPPFIVETCNAGPKEFLKLTKEELLNLTPYTVLSIPTLLGEKYSISPGFLQDALRPYLIQTTGKDKLERKFDIYYGKYMICATKHYSWPKGGGEFLPHPLT